MRRTCVSDAGLGHGNVKQVMKWARETAVPRSISKAAKEGGKRSNLTTDRVFHPPKMMVKSKGDGTPAISRKNRGDGEIWINLARLYGQSTNQPYDQGWLIIKCWFPLIRPAIKTFISEGGVGWWLDYPFGGRKYYMVNLKDFPISALFGLVI